ncbi:MAG: right-handed parallel beta-helix repeat-containing protein [Phycisphaeraceae bacterium]
MKHALLMMGLILGLAVNCQAEPGVVSLADFGAVMDGATDDAAAFKRAFDSGAKVVEVPAGAVAASEIVAPAGVTLRGVSEAGTVLVPTENASSRWITLHDDTVLERLTLDGRKAEAVAVWTGHVSNVKIRHVTIHDFQGMAIQTDHTTDMLIEDCTIENVQRATDLQFSRHVRVVNNVIRDCTEHGLQFWGNWQWQDKLSADLQFIGNRVTRGGGGAIWGTGAKRVLIANNIVDGAEDVGIDLEWCDDSVITGNVVRRARNGGIALFFACHGVAITGNTVINDYPIPHDFDYSGFWVWSGIWLTYPNRETFPDDHGHRDITIVGNVVLCAEGRRRAMWIGSESKNVTLGHNTIRGGGIWYGGAHRGAVAPMERISDNHVVNPTKED